MHPYFGFLYDFIFLKKLSFMEFSVVSLCFGQELSNWYLQQEQPNHWGYFPFYRQERVYMTD